MGLSFALMEFNRKSLRAIPSQTTETVHFGLILLFNLDGHRKLNLQGKGEF